MAERYASTMLPNLSAKVTYDCILFAIAGYQSFGAVLLTHPAMRFYWIASWAGAKRPSANRGDCVLSGRHGRSGLLRRLVRRAAWGGLGLVALACCMGWWITSRAKPHCYRGVLRRPDNPNSGRRAPYARSVDTFGAGEVRRSTGGAVDLARNGDGRGLRGFAKRLC